MKQVVAYLLYKHDEGSYTLQRVKFEKEAYQSMLSEYVCLSGNEDDVLSRLPLIQYGEKTPFNKKTNDFQNTSSVFWNHSFFIFFICRVTYDYLVLEVNISVLSQLLL